MQGMVSDPANQQQQNQNQPTQIVTQGDDNEDKPEVIGGTENKKRDEFGEDFDIPAFLRKIH